MTNDQDVSIIIPSHKRHAYIDRCITYFKQFGCRVLIVDSSEDRYSGPIEKNIAYIHEPKLGFVSKVIKALSLVETEYVALCADDDFLIRETFYSVLAYIKHSSDMKAGLGHHLGFKQGEADCFYPIYRKMEYSQLCGNSKERVKMYLENYYQILWSIFEKCHLEVAFNIIEKSEIKNDNFIEVILASYFACVGNIYISPHIFGVREIANHSWGRRHKQLYTLRDDDCFHDEFKRINSNLTEYLGEGVGDIAIKGYFKFCQRKYSLYRRVVSKFYQLDKQVDYRNFNTKPITQALEKNC